jgi:hypothetical protein
VGYGGRGLGDVTSQTRDAKSPANHFQPYIAWHQVCIYFVYGLDWVVFLCSRL